MSDKSKSASRSAIEVRNRGKTIGTEEKLSVIMRREKGERIVDVCRNSTLSHGIVHKIRDNADRLKESAQSGTEVFVQQGYHSPIRTRNCGCEPLTFLLH